MKYAILIDAGFLKHKLGSRAAPLDAARVSSFVAAVRSHEALRDMRLHRVYWYDAPPLGVRVKKPLRGGRVNFGATTVARSNAALIKELCEFLQISGEESSPRQENIDEPLDTAA